MKAFSYLFHLVIIIAFGSAIAGCCLRIQQPLNEKELMPLRIGNWWKARQLQNAWSHNFSGYSKETITFEEFRVVKVDTSLEREAWYVMSDSSLLSKMTDGIRRRVPQTHKYENWLTMLDGVVAYDYELKMPRRTGDTVWSKTFPRSDSSYIRYLGIAEKLDTLICVPAGKFRCFMVVTHIDAPGIIRSSSYWRDTNITFYAPGFGKVKEVGANSNPVGGNVFTWELIDYKIQ